MLQPCKASVNLAEYGTDIDIMFIAANIPGLLSPKSRRTMNAMTSDRLMSGEDLQAMLSKGGLAGVVPRLVKNDKRAVRNSFFVKQLYIIVQHSSDILRSLSSLTTHLPAFFHIVAIRQISLCNKSLHHMAPLCREPASRRDPLSAGF